MFRIYLAAKSHVQYFIDAALNLKTDYNAGTVSLDFSLRHLQTAACKAFQHVKVDTLCQPEAVSTVAVPGEFLCLL